MVRLFASSKPFPLHSARKNNGKQDIPLFQVVRSYARELQLCREFVIFSSVNGKKSIPRTHCFEAAPRIDGWNSYEI
jgi:hypothetical protein